MAKKYIMTSDNVEKNDLSEIIADTYDAASEKAMSGAAVASGIKSALNVGDLSYNKIKVQTNGTYYRDTTPFVTKDASLIDKIENDETDIESLFNAINTVVGKQNSNNNYAKTISMKHPLEGITEVKANTANMSYTLKEGLTSAFEYADNLADDIATVNDKLGGLSFSVSGTTLSITDGTNTWTLSN